MIRKTGVQDIAAINGNLRGGALSKAFSSMYGNNRAGRRFRARKAKKDKTNEKKAWWEE